MINPVKVIVVGMGARAMIYAGEALSHPELFTIAGIVDINQERYMRHSSFFMFPTAIASGRWKSLPLSPNLRMP